MLYIADISNSQKNYFHNNFFFAIFTCLYTSVAVTKIFPTPTPLYLQKIEIKRWKYRYRNYSQRKIEMQYLNLLETLDQSIDFIKRLFKVKVLLSMAINIYWVFWAPND